MSVNGKAAERKPAISPGDLEGLLASAVIGKQADIDELSLRASINLKRASLVLNQREGHILQPATGRTAASLRVLTLVWAFGPIEAKDLARLSGVTRQAVSGCLATLERDALVQREYETEGDKRLMPITVTSAGHEFVEKYLVPQNEVHQGFFRALDEDELRTLVALLARLVVSDHAPTSDRRATAPGPK